MEQPLYVHNVGNGQETNRRNAMTQQHRDILALNDSSFETKNLDESEPREERDLVNQLDPITKDELRGLRE
jgi:hypothetical protein